MARVTGVGGIFLKVEGSEGIGGIGMLEHLGDRAFGLWRGHLSHGRMRFRQGTGMTDLGDCFKRRFESLWVERSSGAW